MAYDHTRARRDDRRMTLVSGEVRKHHLASLKRRRGF